MAEKSWLAGGALRALDVTSSLGTTILTGAGGLSVRGMGPRPEQRLILYDFEACPFCRKVRELLSDLDLEVEVRPCPKGGRRFRLEVGRRGGRELAENAVARRIRAVFEDSFQGIVFSR